MTIDLTALLLAIGVVFASFGWLHGIRRTLLTTGGLFFALALVHLIGSQLIAEVTKLSGGLDPPSLSGVILALWFVLTVYIVQLVGVRLLGQRPAGTLTRNERTGGAVMGALNGSFLVANALRFATPFLQATEDPRIGGWAVVVPFPQLTHPDAATVSVSIRSTMLAVTPSRVLALYDTIPIPLIFLLAFLVFVFVGSLYGRTAHGGE